MSVATEALKERPAESTAFLAGTIAALVGHIFKLDGDTVGYLAIIVGAIPAGITWVVNLRRS